MQFNTEEAAYARLISHNMTVPQRIKATGDIDDDHHGMNGTVGGWDYASEKFDMNVPDRIMLAGQDQHVGAKAPPREIQLDNAVLPTDPGMIRVNTPPRVITLDQHYFPSANDFPRGMPSSPTRVIANSVSPRRSQGDGGPVPTRPDHLNDTFMSESRLVLREQSPPGEGLSASEELLHLRRQLVKLNRRVMGIEADLLQRQQKDKIIYSAAALYIIYKIIGWLNRN